MPYSGGFCTGSLLLKINSIIWALATMLCATGPSMPCASRADLSAACHTV